MNKLKVFKVVVNTIVSIGVGAIVSNAIKSTTPDTAGTIKKICVGIGAFVIGSMITDKATAYVEGKIDETVKTIEEVGGEVKEEVLEEGA